MAVLIEKQFVVKIYDSTGTTLRTTLQPQKVKNKITFTSRINGGFGQVVLDLQLPFDDFDEGNNIAFMNIVDIFEVDENNTLGRLVYKGFISAYTPYFQGSQEGVKVTCLGMVSLLGFAIYKDAGNFTVTKTTEDPAAIIKDIIDHFNSVYTPNIISHWNFDESTGGTAFDIIGGNDGAITGTSIVSGISGNARNFAGAGSGDRITVTDDVSIQNVFDGGGTISAWIKPASDGELDLGRVMVKGVTGNFKWRIHVQDDDGSDMKLVFDQAFSGTNGGWDTVNRDIPRDQWTHIAITYDNSDVANDPIIYVNGSAVAITETSTPSGTRTTDVGDDLYIGNRDGGTIGFDGDIDEPRIYGAVLNANRVKELFDEPTKGDYLVYYTPTSIDTVGTNVSYEYEAKTWIDAIKETFDLVDPGWYWRIDQNAIFYLKQKPSAATNTFTIGRDIEEMNVEKSSEDVINKSRVSYNSGASNLDVSDTASIDEFGTREVFISDDRITDATTATQRAEKPVNDNNDEKIKASMRVNSQFDIETIAVGQTCKIRNLNNDSQTFNDNMQIVAVTYDFEFAKLELEELTNFFGVEMTRFIS